MKHRALFLIITSCLYICLNARSPYRPNDPTIGKITIKWDQDDQVVKLRDSHLERYAFFDLFDDEFFQSHLLPQSNIQFRNHPEKQVSGAYLNKLIEGLLEEIKMKKKHYTHFSILTKKNFNRQRGCGMLVLKFRNYPFIVKLSIETPASFINPYCKGFDNIWFFPMGGGVNRHLAGFTRVKNLEIIKQKVSQHPLWSQKISLPRKWYWVKSDSWLEITGTDMQSDQPLEIKIPGIYAIIADEIKPKKRFSLLSEKDTQTAMQLCNYLEHWIDPHINNFMIEQETNKIVIVDTEHFPSVVGLKEHVEFDNYRQWYSYLARKCADDWFLRTKQARIKAQTRTDNFEINNATNYLS